MFFAGYKQLEGLRTQNKLTHTVQEYVWRLIYIMQYWNGPADV